MRIWLINYDIADAKRWRAVEKCLMASGTRIQESVFLLKQAYRQHKLMQETLASLIQPSEDALAWYPLCERCQAGADHQCPALSDLFADYWLA